MNIELMNEQVEALKTIEPTEFCACHCSFWATAMKTFTNHLPNQHKKYHLYKNIWSYEALKAFKTCCPIGTVTTTNIS